MYTSVLHYTRPVREPAVATVRCAVPAMTCNLSPLLAQQASAESAAKSHQAIRQPSCDCTCMGLHARGVYPGVYPGLLRLPSPAHYLLYY